MRFVYLYLLVLFLLPHLQIRAQEELNLPDSQWKLFKLGNTNIPVLHIQNTQNPVFQVELHLPLGFNIQDSTNAGILRIFSQLFFQTTHKHPTSQDLDLYVKSLGLELNYRISADGFHAEVVAPQDHALVSMQMLRDWVLYPKITDVDWVRSKTMFARWLQSQEENAGWLLKAETNKIVAGSLADKLGNSGNFVDLSKWTLAQFNDFRNFWMYPNQGLLTICSPMQPKKLELMSDSVWKEWKPAIQMPKDLVESPTLQPINHDSTAIITFEKAKVPQALITWVPEKPVTGFYNELITKGLVKWLNWKGHYLQMNSGNWKLTEFYFEPKNLLNTLELNCIAGIGDWKTSWDSLQASLDWLKNHQMSDDETEMIKNWLLADVDYSHEKPSDYAHGLGNHWIRFGNFDYIYLKDSILNISTEQIHAIKNQWFANGRKTIVWIGNSSDQAFLKPETWLYPHKPDTVIQDTLIAENTSTKIPENTSTKIPENTATKIPENTATNKKELPFDLIETEKEQLFFELNSYKVDTLSKNKLASFAKFLKDYPELRVKLHGHSDTRGDANYNLMLSKKRVESVKWLLIHRHKIDPKRIYTKAWGETKPLYPEDKPENIAKNRRVELEIFVP
jgi:outer membrane protein OmpA-like peptidoglycan-associated protein